MAVNILNSAGYAGDINATEWAQIIPHAGEQYGVLDEGSWNATIGAADREVRLSAGVGWGGGIMDRTTTDASIVLPASSSGSVYHLIHVHRDWNVGRSSFTSKAGSASRSIPSRDTIPGQADDQPLWLARVDAGKSQVQELIDLRVWGGAYALSDLVLQYLNQLGTTVSIAGVIWRRELNAAGNRTWVKARQPQGGQVETLTGGAIVSPNSTAPLTSFAIPEAVAAGSLLHIAASVEIYMPNGASYAGFLQIVRESDGVVLAQRRWHSQGRSGRFIYPSVELNLPVTQGIAAGTSYRFATTSDPLTSGGIEVWHAFMSWGVS